MDSALSPTVMQAVNSSESPVARPLDLWFDDGNIIIQAETTQFRVYRGVLAARSSVFEDMLLFPQPPDSELVEGCPLVQLSDFAVEVTVFLRAIFDSGFFPPFPSRTDYTTVSGVLRLSHKYGVQYLRDRALLHLSAAFPWFNPACGRMVKPSKRTFDRSPDPVCKILVIQLAREVEAPWILPGAFYTLATSYPKLGVQIFQSVTYNGVTSQLSEADQQAFITGSQMQYASTVDDMLRFLFFSADMVSCTQPARCQKRRLQAFEAKRQDRLRSSYDPLKIWRKDDWASLNDVCFLCQVSMVQAHHETAQRLTNELPNMYGLPSWTVLDTLRKNALGDSFQLLVDVTPS